MKSEEATTFWRQFFAAADRMREIGSSDYEQLLVNMTFNQLRMIKIVHVLNRDAPEGITLKTLAEALSITPAAASEMVDALVRKDVLRRDHTPLDRRAVAISLSDSSRKGFNSGERKLDEMSRTFLDSLSKEDRENFFRLLGEFARQLGTEIPE